jgi:hypothetical protein
MSSLRLMTDCARLLILRADLLTSKADVGWAGTDVEDKLANTNEAVTTAPPQ